MNSSIFQNLKVALVHDYLIRFGGAERVLLALRDIFPQAVIYTLLYDSEKMGKYFKGTEIRASFCQKFPFWQKNHRFLLPLLPSAVESFNLRDYDLVVSSSSAFSKGLILRTKTLHFCYCHSPTRFLWDYTHSYDYPQIFRPLVKIITHWLRLWDRSAAGRVDYFIANSKTTASRIKKYYGREAKVIYPPVKTANPSNLRNFSLDQRTFSAPKEYFLIVSQLSPYKQIDLAIRAFNKLGLPLIIIGQGRDRKRLEKIAQSNIKILGWQSDEVIAQYYQNCQALILPGEEDFGLTPVEAMSFGKPVLAYRKGGATESILEGITGEFFDDLDPASVIEAVWRLRQNLKNYSPLVIKKRAEKFSEERFKEEIREFILEKWQNH